MRDYQKGHCSCDLSFEAGNTVFRITTLKTQKQAGSLQEENRPALLLVLLHGMDHLLGGCLLCGCQSSPAFKQLLQLRCQLNHFALCKELGKGDAIASADCFQSGNRWNGIPAEDIRNCCITQSAPSG